MAVYHCHTCHAYIAGVGFTKCPMCHAPASGNVPDYEQRGKEARAVYEALAARVHHETTWRKRIARRLRKWRPK